MSRPSLEEIAKQAQLAIDTPLPMDDDDDFGASEGMAADKGYGPVRRKEQEKEMANEHGIVLMPADVEECAIQTEMDCTDDADPNAKPNFPALAPKDMGIMKQFRRIMVPQSRFAPLKKEWMNLIQPLIEHMKLQVRMNVKRRCVEVRNSKETKEIGHLQKAADYFRAFMLGFEQSDAVSLLRLDDLFLESFTVTDVKRLGGDHKIRAIGRIAGTAGKTKYAIENSTRTRISLNGEHVHILGSHANIRLARHSICHLILGSEAGKVYTKLRTVAKRLQERV